MKGAWIVFGVAAVVFLASAASWALRGAPPSVPLPPSGERGIEPVSLRVDVSPGGAWTEPRAQSSGPDWIFDLFTPPLVYFNPQTGTFTLTPPLRRAAPPPFGLALTRLERPLYRLQYAAHAGDAGRYIVELENVEGGSWVRGRAGQILEDLDARIVRFSTERVRVPSEIPGQTAYVEDRVELVLYDERLGEEVVLTRSPRYVDRILVEVATPDGLRHQFDRSGLLELPDGRFQLREIDLDGGSIVVEKTAPGEPGVTRRLPLANPDSLQ